MVLRPALARTDRVRWNGGQEPVLWRSLPVDPADDIAPYRSDLFSCKVEPMSAEPFQVLREQMVAEIAAGAAFVSDRLNKTALDERVMQAMAKIPRHEFVPFELQPYAYANVPLPIGFDKTISQPFILALMTDLLEIR